MRDVVADCRLLLFPLFFFLFILSRRFLTSVRSRLSPHAFALRRHVHASFIPITIPIPRQRNGTETHKGDGRWVGAHSDGSVIYWFAVPNRTNRPREPPMPYFHRKLFDESGYTRSLTDRFLWFIYTSVPQVVRYSSPPPPALACFSPSYVWYPYSSRRFNLRGIVSHLLSHRIVMRVTKRFMGIVSTNDKQQILCKHF